MAGEDPARVCVSKGGPCAGGCHPVPADRSPQPGACPEGARPCPSGRPDSCLARLWSAGLEPLALEGSQGEEELGSIVGSHDQQAAVGQGLGKGVPGQHGI